MDLLDLDRRALAATGAHVGAVGSDDLTRPTPCAEWDVRALLNHVLGNNHLYASAVEGARSTGRRARPGPRRRRPARGLHRVGRGGDRRLRRADLAAEVDLPFGRLPAAQAVAVHFVDVLAHGWDLAVALGRDSRLDPELASAALDIVAFYPPDVFGTPIFFAEQQPCPTDAPPDVRLVATLGRTV